MCLFEFISFLTELTFSHSAFYILTLRKYVLQKYNSKRSVHNGLIIIKDCGTNLILCKLRFDRFLMNNYVDKNNRLNLVVVFVKDDHDLPK